MSKMTIRALAAALGFVLALAPASLPAHPQPQSPEPTTVEKAERAAERAVDATARGTKKAWKATRRGVRKAAKATQRGVTAAGSAVENAAGKAADATRRTGDKIGEHIPGTAQHEAAKNQKP